jgi:16S rRNA (guanine966-N2)-methyltransferase
VRIIAGSLGGRQFESPHGHRTHPMSDKIRGAIFNMLGDIKGLTVLDAFAGSGALSFEAVSRGARNVTALDVDNNAKQAIKRNIEQLGLADRIKFVHINAGTWSNKNRHALFDIVLCDPPYDDVQLLSLYKLVRNVKPGGLYVLSWPGKIALPTLKDLDMVTQKDYGDAQLVFYRRIP